MKEGHPGDGVPLSSDYALAAPEQSPLNAAAVARVHVGLGCKADRAELVLHGDGDGAPGAARPWAH